jgi:hypothetical protein
MLSTQPPLTPWMRAICTTRTYCTCVSLVQTHHILCVCLLGLVSCGVFTGPIQTPLIYATLAEEKVEKLGTQTYMQRPGQPGELSSF